MENMSHLIPPSFCLPVQHACQVVVHHARALLVPFAVLVATGCATSPSVEQAASVPPPSVSPTVAVPAPAVSPPPQQPQVNTEAITRVTPEKLARLRQWTEQQSRLYAVAAPLLVHNTELCKRQARPLLGFTAKTRFSYEMEFVGAAQEGLGLDDYLRVMDILPGSGAEKSGIQRGDILLEVEDKPVPKGKQAERAASMLIGTAMQNRSRLKLSLLRGQEQIQLDVPLTPACAFSIEVGGSDAANSYSDGYRVMVTQGLLDFVQSDEELAYVLAKEIAHGILTRSPRPRMRAIINKLKLAEPQQKNSALALPAPYSPVLDATADKLALYLLARADVNLDNVLPFWKRLAKRYPASMTGSHTALHPSTAYRLSVMTQVLQHIKTKKAHKQPLLPF